MTNARSHTIKKEKKLIGSNGEKFFYRAFNRDLSTARDKRESMGIITGLYDSENVPILTGNIVKYWYSDTEYQWCIIGFSKSMEKFVALYGNWEKRNPYDPRSYSKYNNITSDNGSRMKFTKVYDTFDDFVKKENKEII